MFYGFITNNGNAVLSFEDCGGGGDVTAALLKNFIQMAL
jgi:hypothetical protein